MHVTERKIEILNSVQHPSILVTHRCDIGEQVQAASKSYTHWLHTNKIIQPCVYLCFCLCVLFLKFHLSDQRNCYFGFLISGEKLSAQVIF